MSMAAAHLWHKPSERAAWMRRFVIVSDSTIRIYGTRNDHESHLDPMYHIELLTSTNLVRGSDNIVHMGWLTKKGKIKWNERWCALVKYGYLNYIDRDQKQGIRSIDISVAKFILSADGNNGISWTVNGIWYQFRCGSKSEQKKWHNKMLEIQTNCMKIRKQNQLNNSLNKEPTLFAFTVQKPRNNSNDNNVAAASVHRLSSNTLEEHLFCADNDQYLEGWYKCITEQIAHSTDNLSSKHKDNVHRNSIKIRAKLTASSIKYRTNSDLYQRQPSAANVIQSYKSSIDGIFDGTIDDEDIINEKMIELMNTLRIPKNAQPKMMNLNIKQKIQMLQQYAMKNKTKQKESGIKWSQKFASYKQVNINTLQQFSVVLRDEDDKFVKQFIESLGLNHLCRLAAKSTGGSSTRGKGYSTAFDLELLRVMKAIIDTNELCLKSLVENDIATRIIVEKIDSEDKKVRELTLSLLVTMVGINNDEISISASNKILCGLRDLAKVKGQRNKYKALISHMSPKDVLNASYQYDTYTVTLINYIIMGLEKVDHRMDERRLLNSLQFNKILNKLEDRTRRKTIVTGYQSDIIDALINQIETYRNLYETDKRSYNNKLDGNDNDWDMHTFDIDNPNDLLKRVHDQALADGFINELTSILKNLVVLPPTAEQAWYNVSKIVGTACQPTINNTLDNNNDNKDNTDNKDDDNKANDNKDDNNQPITHRKHPSDLNFVTSNIILNNQNIDDNYMVSQTGAIYPSYDQLYRMLEIRDAQEQNSDINSFKSGMKIQLDEAHEKQIELEEALMAEKSKNLSLMAQINNFKQFGTRSKNTPSTIPLSQQSSSNSSSFIVVDEEKTPKPNTPSPKTPLAAISSKTPTVVQSTTTTAKPKTPAPAANDPLNKYRKMIKFKMPKASVLNRMRQDQISNDIIEQYDDTGILPGGNSLAASTTSSSTTSKPASNDPKAAMLAMIAAKSGKKPATGTKSKPAVKLSKSDEDILKKYKKMLAIKLPKQSVINRMRQDQIEKRLIGALFPDAPEAGGNKSSGGSGTAGLIKKKKKEKAALPPNLKPKKVIKPNNKMRNLHWTKVNPFDIDKTIWNKIDDENIKMNITDLESKFCWKQIEKKDNNKTKEIKKNDVVRVLDTRRAYNVEIFLGRLKMDTWTMRQALLHLNSSKLPIDTINKLINFVPTKEEAALLDGYENEKNLGVAENFFKIIRTVEPNLVERLKLWSFKIEFNELYNTEYNNLKYLRKGYNSIKKSSSFKLVLSIILSIGNYMNGSTNKGQAYGFKLSSFSQLLRSRTVDNTQTLMEYIYVFMSSNNKYKEGLKFLNDLECLSDATSVDISVLRQSISAIGAKLRVINLRINNFNQKQLVTRMGDNFYKIMKPFYDVAIKKYESLTKLRDEIFNELKVLGIWLNEPRDSNFKYFKTVNEFRINFQKAIKLTKEKQKIKLEIEKKRKWKEQRRKDKLAAKSKKKSNKNNKNKKNNGNNDGNNVKNNKNIAHSSNNAPNIDNKNNTIDINNIMNIPMRGRTNGIISVSGSNNDDKKVNNNNNNNNQSSHRGSIDMDDNMNNIDKQNRESIKKSNPNNLRATHTEKKKNTSDLVIQSIVNGTMMNSVKRLLLRNKRAQTKIKY